MIISITGHRPNKLNNAYPKTRAYDILVEFAQWVICQQEPSKVLVGMALGFDCAVAQACLNLKLPYFACVPFKGQETMWPYQSQVYYRFLCANAAKVIFVSDPGYENWKMQKRNAYMVDNGDRQIALWDGSSGGTCNCVKYAKKKEKESINVWDKWRCCINYYKELGVL